MSKRHAARLARLARACALLCLAACDRFATIGTVDTPADAAEAGMSADDAEVEPPVTAIDECAPNNAAGLAGARLVAARAGGPLAPDARVLYPYDDTVFPANLPAPLLMWQGPPADAVYVQARAGGLRYEGCLLPSGDHELALPATLWEAARQTGEPLAIALTTLSGESASGPLNVSVRISPDPISGLLYYSAYGSLLAGPINLAAVMRLPLGGTAEPLIAPQGGCAGCHAVSANGATMLASVMGLGNRYDLPGAAERDPIPSASNLAGAEFAAIDPTGSFYLAPARPALLGPRTLGASPQLWATLFELATGGPVSNTRIPDGAMTPAFSPDGKWLAFNDAAGDGHTLALMAFSAPLRQASDYRVIGSDPERFLAWPTFRPGAEHVIFAAGVAASFDGEGTLLSELVGPPGPSSDLYAATLDGTQSTLLLRAAGFTSDEAARAEQTYLPFGDEDLHQNYHPSILPRRTGAHDWLFFDSVRNYGNRGVVRGIWCAALSVDPEAAQGFDFSHPPFFVPGQEPAAANLRPIAARDP